MNARLVQLRSLIAARFPGAVDDRLAQPPAPEGLAAPQLLAGRLVEVVTSPGCGGEGLLLWHFCTEAKGTLALVDGADAFDPPALSSAIRQRLLWLRCRGAGEAVRAADLILRDGNLSTLLLDLRLLPERELLRLPSSVWHRLRMLAERAQGAVGIFSPCRLVPCAARRWVLDAGFGVEALEEETPKLAARLHPRPAAEVLAFAS